MKKIILTTFVCIFVTFIGFSVFTLNANAQGTSIQVTAKNGKQLTLDQKHFYVNSSISADDAASFKFRTIQSAMAAAVDGTEAEPMVIYIEPDVYQMNGTLTDRGLYVNKDWVSFIGLCDDPQDVVLADNRGHTIGAQPGPSGNSPAETIFVTGTGFHAENLTIGNYCNVDLVYPKDTSKNQPKRSSTITQAYCIGAANSKKTLDKFYFKNVRLISMLDTTGLGDVQRAYYENCYVQGTDDYMGGGNVKVLKDSTLHCYSSKPVYTSGTNGMAFINCKWDIDFADMQDLTITKNSSTLYLINNQFNDLNNKVSGVKWAPYPASNVKSCEYNTKFNGNPYVIGPAANGIELNTEQLKGYTVYSLLKGTDGWDPANDRTTSSSIDLPLSISIDKGATTKTGETPATINAKIFPSTASQHITWSVNSTCAAIGATTGSAVTIVGNNNGENPIDVTVTATADDGIYNQSIVTVYPSFIDPPKFTKLPAVTEPEDGKISADYALDLSYSGGTREDQSIITWYRCDDKNGTNPIEVAVSRDDKPLYSYTLTSGDAGHYMKVTVQPKHLRCNPGDAAAAISNNAITMNDISGTGMAKYNYNTNFENFPAVWQPELIDGTWAEDAYYPKDQYIQWQPATSDSWNYTSGINGAAGVNGLLTVGRGARLLYTQDGQFGDMALHLTLNPEKNAGQGFGSANGQYLEAYIKYDTKTKTGYALRIERTTKYGVATDFTLYEYKNGVGKAISNSVSTTAFNPGCTIDLYIKNNVLYANATSTTPQTSDQISKNLPNSVSLSAQVSGNMYGGAGIQHTGTVGGGNRTQLTSLSISYSGDVSGVVSPADIVVKKGDTVTLPSKVIENFNNGISRLADVTWTTKGAIDVNTPGTYTVNGTVDGYAAGVTIKVIVATPVSNTVPGDAASAVKSAADGSATVVDLTSNAVVSKDVFNNIEGQNKDVIFQKDGVTWKFNGKDITSSTASDIDLSLKPVSDYLKSREAAKVKSMTGNNEEIIPFSFNYNGSLPAPATVKVYINKDWAGKKVTVCRYDEGKNIYETITNAVVDSDGYITITINHCSDYFVTQAGSLPKTGSFFDSKIIMFISMIFLIIGILMIKVEDRKRRQVVK